MIGYSYTAVDDSRFLLGDLEGHLCMLSVSRNGPSNAVSEMAALDLGPVCGAAFFRCAWAWV